MNRALQSRFRRLQHAGQVDTKMFDPDLVAAFAERSGKDFGECVSPYPDYWRVA